MNRLVTRFVIRWLVSALGLLVASALFSSHIQLLSDGQTWLVALVAGLILALINMFLKPILVILSIPALILSLGLFMLVVNGFLVWLVDVWYSSLYITNFGWAVVAGIIIGLVNYLVTRVLEDL